MSYIVNTLRWLFMGAIYVVCFPFHLLMFAAAWLVALADLWRLRHP